jgi:hypothetical protein
MKQVASLVNPDALDAELAWRWQWLETQGYAPQTTAPFISFHAADASGPETGQQRNLSLEPITKEPRATDAPMFTSE